MSASGPSRGLVDERLDAFVQPHEVPSSTLPPPSWMVPPWVVPAQLTPLSARMLLTTVVVVLVQAWMLPAP